MLTQLDWLIIVLLLATSLFVGLYFSYRTSKQGLSGYFAAGRQLRWWSIGFSSSANYQSGSAGFVMLVLTFGLAGNWLWWASWVIWMPLVALIWAPMWRRMEVSTTAELISLRYGGKAAVVARKAYAFVNCFGFAVLLIGYITGFLVKTIAPIIEIKEIQVLLIFGIITLVYTMFGGLKGVVYSDVLQFIFMIIGSFLFFYFAAEQHGGMNAVISKIENIRPEALKMFPPTSNFSMVLFLLIIVQGFFFAGSPTAGEGSTAQRFMAAKSELEAMKGQFFNSFLSLSLRIIPLLGIGLICLSVYTTPQINVHGNQGLVNIKDPVYAWGEILKSLHVPKGFTGLMIATEVAAFMSTLSTLINWGSSFLVNDIIKLKHPENNKRQIFVSRLATFALFIVSGTIAAMFVNNMVSWFVFINSAMVIFLLPLAWFRFFWWRYNVWGELSAIIVGLPFSIFVWFGLGYQDETKMAAGLAILLVTAFASQIIITLLTPPEKMDKLKKFYLKCRPPGFWGPVAKQLEIPHEVAPKKMLWQSFLGIATCVGMVIVTNSIFTGNLLFIFSGITLSAACGYLLFKSIKLNIQKQKSKYNG